MKEEDQIRIKQLVLYAKAYPLGSPERNALEAELESYRRRGLNVPIPAPAQPTHNRRFEDQQYLVPNRRFLTQRDMITQRRFLSQRDMVPQEFLGGTVRPLGGKVARVAQVQPSQAGRPPAPARQHALVRRQAPAPMAQSPLLRFESPQQMADWVGTTAQLVGLGLKGLRGLMGRTGS